MAAPPPADAASVLARYVPAEAIALYGAILPTLVPDGVKAEDQSYASRWVLAAGVAMVAELFALGVWRRDRRAHGLSMDWPWLDLAMVLTAFFGWVALIPGSPFGVFPWYSPASAVALGLAAVIGISLMHLWFGPAVPTESRTRHARP